MRFLRRGGGEAEQPIEQRLEAFWTWWAAARDGIAADIERGTVAGRAPEISGAVDALHAKLAWELSPGATASTRSSCRLRAMPSSGPSRSAGRPPLPRPTPRGSTTRRASPARRRRWRSAARASRSARSARSRAGTRAGSCSTSASRTRRWTAAERGEGPDRVPVPRQPRRRGRRRALDRRDRCGSGGRRRHHARRAAGRDPAAGGVVHRRAVGAHRGS